MIVDVKNHFVLILILLTLQSSQQEYQNIIHIDPDRGNDTTLCHGQNSSHSPCRSLNYAFQFRSDSTQYVLKPRAVHLLVSSIPPFENSVNLSIIGGSASSVRCIKEGIGLAFLNVSSIVFSDVAFHSCAATRSSTSNYLSTKDFRRYQFRVGIFFYLCQDVSMSRVNISFSPNATGVVMYDTTGRNVVEDSVFTNNSVSGMAVGGGGFYIEFTYCKPGDNTCSNTTQSSSDITGAYYSLRSSVFSNNSAINAGTKLSHSTIKVIPDIQLQLPFNVVLAKLKPCPPILNCSKDTSKVYKGIVSCDPNTHSVTIKKHHWIGKLNWSEEASDEYLVGDCAPSFCNVTTSSLITLPTSEACNETTLSRFICNKNRRGVMCGTCIDGFGPAVNTLRYECVNCTDINLAANIAKYVATSYLPLAVLFSVIIIFDIRLTAGSANAFILYAQVVSSTFSLDAEGQIPMNGLTNGTGFPQDLLDGCKLVYGIFNLEFAENLLHPFCFSTRFNTLSVLLLDYGVALFPLLMIFLVMLCLKIKECCSDHVRPCRKMGAGISRRFSFIKQKRSINEALLPAFATFILLSYTKFSLTSSYITSTQPLIDVSGTPVGSHRVYFAGHMPADSTEYKYVYLLPASIVFTFVCIIPILLFVYPLRALEWCLSKVPFLWKFYPTDKVLIFLDTFQGCYKNNMRFFAGLYFLFRLVINTVYIITTNWIQQYSTQQIICVVMAVLVALCQPYKKEYHIFNYIDPLMFANLAVINSLNMYLLMATTVGSFVVIFILQFILVFIPLVYVIICMICCVVNWLKRWQCCRKEDSHRQLTSMLADGTTSINSPDTETEVDDDDEDESLFARARRANRYRSTFPHTTSVSRIPAGPTAGSRRGYGSISSSEPTQASIIEMPVNETTY